MCKGKIKVIAAIAALLLALPAGAQDESYNTYSPYSVFGVGDLFHRGTSSSKSMGGVGIANRDKRFVNLMNPASVTEREDKSFMADFGLSAGNRLYAQGNNRSANNTFNIYDFAFSFPVFKNFAMYAGITPFSGIGYQVSSKVTDPSIIGHTGNITVTADGYGDMTGIFLGAGYKFTKGLSAGVEVEYIFGNLHKNNAQVFSTSSYSSIYSGYNMHMHAFAPKVGVQYEFPLASEVTATVGATYRLKAGLHGSLRDFEYNVVGSVTDTTRIVTTKLGGDGDRVSLGDEIGVGFSVKGRDRWFAELDYQRSDWTSCGMDHAGFANVGKAVFSATASQGVRAGFSFVPNRNDIRYYYRRITYRGGAYWDQAYYKLDGNTINSFGLTFGVTLPVYYMNNGLSLGVDIGQRGSMQGNKVRERYVNFHIGLNMFEIWFLKPRYN